MSLWSGLLARHDGGLERLIRSDGEAIRYTINIDSLQYGVERTLVASLSTSEATRLASPFIVMSNVVAYKPYFAGFGVDRRGFIADLRRNRLYVLERVRGLA